jgi:hypothetical protein
MRKFYLPSGEQGAYIFVNSQFAPDVVEANSMFIAYSF